jgi:hypothetical protein
MTEALISLLGEAPKWNLRDEAVAFQRKDDIIRKLPIPWQNLHNKLAEKVDSVDRMSVIIWFMMICVRVYDTCIKAKPILQFSRPGSAFSQKLNGKIIHNKKIRRPLGMALKYIFISQLHIEYTICKYNN